MVTGSRDPRPGGSGGASKSEGVDMAGTSYERGAPRWSDRVPDRGTMVGMSVKTDPAEALLTAEQLQRRHRLSVTWAVAVVVWSVIRAVVVWVGLSQYGVNPWAYVIIDLASAGIDAITTPKFVLSLIDSKYKAAGRWGAFTLFAFVIPDIYIFKTTRELPRTVVIIICVVIAVSLAVAVVGVVTKVRAGKHGHPDPAAIPDAGPHD